MNKKTQVAILMATLTMQVGAMDGGGITETIIFNGCKHTASNCLRFVGYKNRHRENEYRIKKVCIRKQISANSKVKLIIPAKVGRHLIQTERRAFAGLNNDNLRISLFFRYSNRYMNLPKNCEKMFYNSSSITDIDFSGINRNSKITNMSSMFEDCNNLRQITWGNLDTRYTRTMDKMFMSCKKLENLNLSTFDTSWVETMRYMFGHCHNLSSINMSNFDTSNVNNMEAMFIKCKSLPYLDLRDFNTRSVWSMERMFKGCSNLSFLNLKSFDTRSLLNMRRMFEGCSSISALDLSTFNVHSVINMHGMLNNCYQLVYVNLDNKIMHEMNNKAKRYNDCISMIAP